MPLYPLCLDIADRLCLVVGGGPVAARKVRGLLDCGARVRLISPELCQDLEALARQGAIELRQRPYTPGDLLGAWLVFAATGVPAVQQAVAAEAAAAAIPCNLADAPAQCTFHVPAVLRRGDLTMAVATAGRSPALAALLRQELAERYGVEYAALVSLLGDLREQLLARRELSGEEQVEALLRRLLHPDLISWIRQGEQERLAGHIRAVLGRDPGLDLAAYLARGGA